MDFALSQEQTDLRDLAAKIFGDLAPTESLPDFEQGQDWHDEKLWAALANAGLLGLSLPEEAGGAGMGLVELCVLLEEAGRWLAPVPLVPTLAMAAAPIAEFGSTDQVQRLLAPVAAGDSVLSAALLDEGARDPATVLTRATKDGSAWRLDGTKTFVPAASLAGAVLTPAALDDDRLIVCLVDPRADGVALEAQTTTTGENEYRVAMTGVIVESSDVLGDANNGRAILDWTVDRTLAALCATELGVADRALRMTAEYTAGRKQFDKPIATFQAVAQRAADAYIDVDAIRLATMQAVWRLAEGLPARRELEIAKFWAAEGGHRACYASQHLHGGIGVDTDYPLHHYYLRSRQIELTLGGAHDQLARLGRRLAEEGSAPS